MLRSDLFSKTVVRVREVGQWREGKPPVPAPNPFCQGTPCRPAGAKPQVCLLAVTKGYQIETGLLLFQLPARSFGQRQKGWNCLSDIFCCIQYLISNMIKEEWSAGKLLRRMILCVFLPMDSIKQALIFVLCAECPRNSSITSDGGAVSWSLQLQEGLIRIS